MDEGIPNFTTAELQKKCTAHEQRDNHTCDQTTGEAIQYSWCLYGHGRQRKRRQPAARRVCVLAACAHQGRAKRIWKRWGEFFARCGQRGVLRYPTANFFASSRGQIGESQAAQLS